MKKDTSSSRRKFLQQIGATGLAIGSVPLVSLASQAKAEERILRYEKKTMANDKVRMA